MTFPKLKTNRFLLRQFISTDIDFVFKGLSHPEVTKYYGVYFPDLAATEEQMKWFAQLEKDGTGIWWAICSPDNKVFYGAGGMNNVNKIHKKAEIGFWLLTEHWGKGIMTEVMPTICNYGFDQLGLHRIEATVETDNVNCKKAINRLNFVHEGTMKDCEFKHGKYISLDIYAKLNTDSGNVR